MNPERINIFIIGQPNCGKSTIFKLLTNSKSIINNYPGTTLEKIIGTYVTDKYILSFSDLPGLYSTKIYSKEEEVVIDELIKHPPNIILYILDPVTINRSLNLAIQILETNIKTIICINMMDEVEKKRVKINFNKLSKLLKTEIIGCCAKKTIEKNKILNTIIKKHQKVKNEINYSKILYDPILNNTINKLKEIIINNKFLINTAFSQWISIKYIEMDNYIISKGDQFNRKLSNELQIIITHNLKNYNKISSKNLKEDIIYDQRNKYIKSILKQNIIDYPEKLNRTISEKIDNILLGGIIGPILIVSIIYLTFFITFKLGYYPKIFIQHLLMNIENIIKITIYNNIIQSLLISIIINGIGTILMFIPFIFIIFFIIDVLEGLGIITRMVYTLDSVAKFFGLHGSSIVPYIISGGIPGGCAIPGIMAAKIIKNTNERFATILTTPFMICGAKLIVYLILVETFFPKHATIVMLTIILSSWIISLLIAKLLRSTTLHDKKQSPFIMELPPYRIPNFKAIILKTFEKIWLFIKRVSTIIILTSIIVCIATTFPQLPEKFNGHNNIKISNNINKDQINNKLEALKYSIAGRIGIALEPLSKLAGFPWQLNIALISGITAKETIISTLATVYSLSDNKDTLLSTNKNKLSFNNLWQLPTVISLLIFMLLYAPCLPSINIIAKQTSWKLAISLFVLSTLLAYILAVIAYQISNVLL